MKKYLTIIIFLAVVVVAIFGYKWYETKMKKVEIGLAEPNFPYRDYTQEELNKMYPQIKYADVLTRIAPEQTYAQFRQALQENNLEMAIEQLSRESEKYEKNMKMLEDFYNQHKFSELYQHYSENITKSIMAESYAQYEYDYFSKEYNQELIGSIDFIKNSKGEWKMDSL